MAATCLAAAPAFAESEEQIASYAVQNRRFGLGTELNVAVGGLPMNAFTKGVTVGGGYTYHSSDLWAWEVLSGFYSFGVDTGLKKQLLENFQVEPTAFPEVEAALTTSVIYKPLYGKLAWLNRRVVHTELFFALGAGLARYRFPASYRVAADAGAGLRLFLTEHVSVRFDARWMSFVNLDNAKNDVYLALSLAFSGGR